MRKKLVARHLNRDQVRIFLSEFINNNYFDDCLTEVFPNRNEYTITVIPQPLAGDNVALFLRKEVLHPGSGYISLELPFIIEDLTKEEDKRLRKMFPDITW